MSEAFSWRTEVWHPLSVHFPITLLLCGTVVMLVSLMIKPPARRPWQTAVSALLFAGCLTAWLANYTGDLADGIVSRKLCDPTVLKDHELAGQTATYLFTAAALVQALILFMPAPKVLGKFLMFLLVPLMVAGSGYLLRASHLGASLVYEQGAAVRDHDTDCTDYE